MDSKYRISGKKGKIVNIMGENRFLVVFISGHPAHCYANALVPGEWVGGRDSKINVRRRVPITGKEFLEPQGTQPLGGQAGYNLFFQPAVGWTPCPPTPT